MLAINRYSSHLGALAFIALAIASLTDASAYTKNGSIYATDGSQSDVSGAIAAASAGETVSIPAGTFIWGTSGAFVSVNKPITLTGAGQANTTIQLAATAGIYSLATIRISAAAVVKDFAVLAPTSGNNASVFSTSGNGYVGWRITNIKYDGYQGGTGKFGYFAYVGGNYGLIDSCTIIGGGGTNELIFARGPDDSYTTPNSMGTQDALYIEDNTFENLGYLTDINANGRAVVRFNTTTGTGLHVDCHMIDTSTGLNNVHHGARQMEVYHNRWTAPAGPWNAIELVAGTGMVFDNTSDHIVSTNQPLFFLYNYGSYVATPYWSSLYPTSPYRTPTYYPIPDQPGSGSYPQSSGEEPYYIWNNLLGTADSGGPHDWAMTWKLIPAAAVTQYQTETGNPTATYTMQDIVKADRDYYKGTYGATFTGTGGIGRGTKAQMLAITPTKAGVGFWVTDEADWNSLQPGPDGQLYVWNGTSWVLRYTPYPYPHPLRGSGSMQNQTITFGALSPMTYGAAPVTLTATASSGLPVIYSSSNTAVATVSGSTLTVVGAGSTTITASQSGNTTYNPAPSVSQSLTVNKTGQTITFGALPSVTYGDPAFNLTASASSGLAVSYTSSNTAVATVTGSTVTIVGAGSATITATQPGDTNYNAAASVAQSLTVNKANQIVTFGALPAVTYGGASFNLTATASSGLAVSYTSSNTAVATVTGSTVTIVGVGSTTITATQPGNSNFTAATPVAQSLTVNKANETITFGALAAKIYGDSAFTLAATASSGLTVSYMSSNTAVATVAGNVVTIVSSGLATIFANQLGDGNYNAATPVAQTLTVNKANQTITFGTLAAKTFGDSAFTLTGTASSGLPVSYASSNAAVATVAGNVVTIVGGGSSIITANQAGDTNYSAAAPVSQSLTVNKASQTITFGPLPTNSPTDLPFTLGATASSGLTVTYLSSNLSVATVSGNTVTIVGVGTSTITAQQAGDANHLAAADVSQPLTVSGSALSFTSQPVNQSVVVAQSATFSATASGNPAPTYQWQQSADSGATWTNLVNDSTFSGVTTASMSVTNASLSLNGHQYRCLASNGIIPNATSNAAVLTVTGSAPTISAQPASQSASAGGTAKFTIAASGNPTPTFQWQLSSDNGAHWNALSDGGSYSGVTTTTLTITSAASGMDQYQFRCIAANPISSATSNAAVLTITSTSSTAATGTPPIITAQPTNQSVSDGQPATFTLGVTGSPTPTIAWQVSTNGGLDWTPVPLGAPYSGTSSTSLVISPAGVMMNGYRYRATASNSLGSAASNAAILGVLGIPVITTEPAGASVPAGSTATFSVVASANPAPTYQWGKNGSPIRGATSPTLTLTNVRQGDAASYAVVVRNSLGAATSTVANLTVTARTFAGTYFGTLSDGSPWALYVRADNTAVYTAHLTARDSALVLNLTVDETGAFSATGPDIVATGGTPANQTVTGVITGTSVAGQVSGNLALNGIADVGNATAALYSADGLESTVGTSYATVGASGKGFVLLATPTIIDSANGTVSSTGVLSATTDHVAQVTVAATQSSQTISVTYNTTRGVALSAKFAGVADGTPITTHLTNASVRCTTQSGENTLIAGFVVSGSGTKPLLIRAVGPTLASFNVDHALADPVLSLFLSTNLLVQNDDWSTATNAADVASASKTVGAFDLQRGSRDAAILASMNAGSYTAQVDAKAGVSGVALVEVYDAGAGNASLTNISARSHVGTGTENLIAGFVVAGNAPRHLLIRAVGPTLSAFGVSGVLADPQLRIVRPGSDTTLAENDNWGGTPELKATFAQLGAFDLDSTSKDAALLITLAPGTYSAIVSGRNNTTGVALVEVYEIPDTHAK